MTPSSPACNAVSNAVTGTHVTPLLTPLVTPLVTGGVMLFVTPPPARPDPTRPINPSNSPPDGSSRLLVIPLAVATHYRPQTKPARGKK